MTETMVIHEPSDSWLLQATPIMVRLSNAAGDLPQAPAMPDIIITAGGPSGVPRPSIDCTIASRPSGRCCIET